MNAGQIITKLTALQADGLACMVCGADYLHIRVPHVPVGLSVTGSQVFACVSGCLSDSHRARSAL